jgi:hypothetical protein
LSCTLAAALPSFVKPCEGAEKWTPPAKRWATDPDRRPSRSQGDEPKSLKSEFLTFNAYDKSGCGKIGFRKRIKTNLMSTEKTNREKRGIMAQGRTYPIEIPDACPVCHRHSELHISLSDVTDPGDRVQVVFRCGYRGCRSFFIGYYGRMGDENLYAIRPIKPDISLFPRSVAEISSTFVAIFAEAEEAAQLGLAQIAGPGYRKAFEFLIKDYAISLAPDKAEEIRHKFSGVVVSEYIPDSRIQAVAKRCLWLGNDETHYLRKWVDHDVDDLVKLIKLTANWIEIGHLSESYIQEMPG